MDNNPIDTAVVPAVSIPDSINLLQFLPQIGEFLPLDKLPWIIFIILMIGFVVISVILAHHWRAYGEGLLMFLSAAIVYFLGAGVLIWATLLLLSIYSLR